MIYNIFTKQMIITPPKTGTTILHNLLCALPNFWYVLGPAKWDTTTKHAPSSVLKTHEIKVDKWILMIRHPSDRIISMWKHRRSYDNYDDSLEDFINHHNLMAGWYAPCTSYVDKIDGIIRQEHMYDDCMKILTVVNPKTEGKPIEKLIEQLEKLKESRMNDSKFKYVPTEHETELLQYATETIYHKDLKVGGYDFSSNKEKSKT